MDLGSDIKRRCQSIELMLSDVDGVLTDGRIVIDNQGVESKQFHIRDGMGVRLWQEVGHRFGLITLRNSHIVDKRAAELGVKIIQQGTDDKLASLGQILASQGLRPEQTCYLGDDFPDLPVIRAVGLGVAVADACEEVRQAADYVTVATGGTGAVRETIEMILKVQHRWDDAIHAYM